MWMYFTKYNITMPWIKGILYPLFFFQPVLYRIHSIVCHFHNSMTFMVYKDNHNKWLLLVYKNNHNKCLLLVYKDKHKKCLLLVYKNNHNKCLLLVYKKNHNKCLLLVYKDKHNKAPAKRSQHFNATYRNIVARNMLHTFGHPVATCCVLLAQVWKWSNFSSNIFGCCMVLHSFGHFYATLLHQGMRTRSFCRSKSQF